jgi:hypothetical protein
MREKVRMNNCITIQGVPSPYEGEGEDEGVTFPISKLKTQNSKLITIRSLQCPLT